MSLETIKKRIGIIHDLQEELKKLKATHDELMSENPTVQEAQNIKIRYDQEMSEVAEKLKAVKDTGAIKNVLDEMKEVKQEIKENKEVVSQELVEYYKETGSMEITDEDGTVYRVTFSAKVKAEN